MIQDHRFLGGAARAANRWSDFLETEGFTIQRMAGDQAEGKGLVLTGKPPRGWGRLFEHFTDHFFMGQGLGNFFCRGFHLFNSFMRFFASFNSFSGVF